MKLSYKLVADRCMQQRRQLMLAALAAGCTITPVPPALAKYGEFARTEAGVSTLAAGDANSDCLFAALALVCVKSTDRALRRFGIAPTANAP